MGRSYERSLLNSRGFSCFKCTQRSGSHRGDGTGYDECAQLESEGYGAILEGALAESLYTSYPWAFELFFGNPTRIMELWTVIARASDFDD